MMPPFNSFPFAVSIYRWTPKLIQTKLTTILTPDKFYKRRSQEKTLLQRLEFFLLRSPRDRARFVLTCRAMCSVVGACAPVVWVFSISGFHRFFVTKPGSSETNKAEPGQIWRPEFYLGLVAYRFFWLYERAY